MKRALAVALRAFGPLRGLFGVAVRLGAPRHRVGVLALVRDPEGRLLLAEHTFRPWNPWGLLGGWMEPGEAPHLAIRRELVEEIGPTVDIRVARLLWADQHGHRGEPAGLSLVFACTVEGELPAALPLELLQLRWTPEAEARLLLRPVELAALDAAGPLAATPSGGG